MHSCQIGIEPQLWQIEILNKQYKKKSRYAVK